MNNYSIIHKIIINNKTCFLYGHIIKNFDYFNPILEKRFNSDLIVNFEFCQNDNIISKFCDVINNQYILITFDEMVTIYNMLEYLICNNDVIFDALLEMCEIKLENLFKLKEIDKSFARKYFEKYSNLNNIKLNIFFERQTGYGYGKLSMTIFDNKSLYDNIYNYMKYYRLHDKIKIQTRIIGTSNNVITFNEFMTGNKQNIKFIYGIDEITISIENISYIEWIYHPHYFCEKQDVKKWNTEFQNRLKNRIIEPYFMNNSKQKY